MSKIKLYSPVEEPEDPDPVLPKSSGSDLTQILSTDFKSKPEIYLKTNLFNPMHIAMDWDCVACKNRLKV